MERDRRFRSISRPEKFELSAGGSTFLGLEKSNFVLSTTIKFTRWFFTAPKSHGFSDLYLLPVDDHTLVIDIIARSAKTRPALPPSLLPCLILTAAKAPFNDEVGPPPRPQGPF